MGRARDETVIDFLEHGKEDSEWGAEYSHHPVEELNRKYIYSHIRNGAFLQTTLCYEKKKNIYCVGKVIIIDRTLKRAANAIFERFLSRNSLQVLAASVTRRRQHLKRENKKTLSSLADDENQSVY